LFIKPLNTLLVVDRLESTTASVTQSWLLHTTGNPTIVNANNVTYTNGGQQVWVATLPTLGAGATRSYSVSNEGGGIYRLQDNVKGTADNVLVHAITAGPSGSDPVSISITGATSTTWTITITSATHGTAVLVLNQGTLSLGGSFGYAASGTPVLSPLANSIEVITVTNNGPVWGSSGTSGSASPSGGVMGVVPNVNDAAASNSTMTSAGTSTKGNKALSGATNKSAALPQTISIKSSRSVSQGRKLVNDKSESVDRESVLDALGRDVVLNKHRKSHGGARSALS
jgi:hypothetical protein